MPLQDDLKKEIEYYERRLQKLRVQRAMGGISTDPGIEIEIEEIEAEIKRLQVEPRQPVETEFKTGSLQSPKIPRTRQQRNREKMLRKVKSFWIDGVLNNSLHGSTLLELGLEYHSGAIEHPWEMILQEPDNPEKSLPGNTKIITVFEQMDGTLLILGEPGSGKTTMLLELARDLIEKAESLPECPIPVVFNLSSWAVECYPITEWFVEELNTKYQIPKTIGRDWILGEQIIPLLDGLDEVDQRYRDECVTAINQYRKEYGLVDIAVCSRISDYQALSNRLSLNGAVLIQPLSDVQIDAYFSSLGDQFTTAQSLFQEDEPLRQLARTPLFLSIITLTYRGTSVERVEKSRNTEERRKRLFDVYVARMLRRRGIHQSYTREKTIHWLTWLAQKMNDDAHTVFFIEQIRPTWLPSNLSRWTFQILVGLIVPLILGSLAGLAVSLSIWMLSGSLNVDSLVYGIATGLGLSVAAWFSLNRIFGWICGLWVGFSIGLPFAVGAWYYSLPPIETAIWLTASLTVGITLGYLGKRVSTRQMKTIKQNIETIRMVEAINWSGSKAFQALLAGLITGITFGTIAGFLLAFRFNLQSGIMGGLLIGSGSWIAVIAVFGLGGTEVETRTFPNQGIVRSAQSAIRAGTIGGLYLGIAPAITGYFFFGVEGGLLTFFGFALFGIAAAGTIYGGFACIQHFLIRVMLYVSGSIPRDYAEFLDYATECLLMRKVGGGYIFIHRYLLDYFADLDPTVALNNPES